MKIPEQIALTAIFYFGQVFVLCRLINKKHVWMVSTEAGLTLNDLYDTTCMIQLVWNVK